MLGTITGIGATTFVIPTAAANDENESNIKKNNGEDRGNKSNKRGNNGRGGGDKSNKSVDDDLPDWINETPENEVELIDAESQPSNDSNDFEIQTPDPEWQKGFDFEAGGREFEATLSIYDMDDPICNYGITISTGIYSGSGDRVDCEGSNSLGVDVIVADVEVTIEPLSGTFFEDGLRLTGEVCVGGWRIEECDDMSIEFEF
ncbi:hypothetical protein RBH26_06545 [Natronolimnohabitans sp. A-GB9]|uniref:hypothetical protein n=1 Tax=Natronolimnohabitans sp. A-GB9 TaxID=3069757 RepID=UPI0027B28B25|nr:hypothetical protein [Natronolimnohabitans sp. A-GB9]MDQ2050140.1 hypothetical protein [Natronolimnohabitans sp. A-GB9]